MLEDFKKLMNEKKVKFTDEEFEKNKNFVIEGIEREIFYASLGKINGYRVQLKEDLQFKEAVKTMQHPETMSKELQNILAHK